MHEGSSRRVLISGANRGLGLALTRALLAEGATVFAGHRDNSNTDALRALKTEHPATLVPILLDVTSEDSRSRAIQEIAGHVEGIDLLINNAGIHSQSRELLAAQRNLVLGELESTGLNAMLQTNAIAPLLLTQGMLPLLTRGHAPRVLNMSSRRGSLATTTAGGNYGYCLSKAALNMASRILATDLAARGIVVIAVHPGAVQTDMRSPDACLTPAQSARAILELTDTLALSDAGQFYNWDGTVHPW